jgi:hypothetical protein
MTDSRPAGKTPNPFGVRQNGLPISLQHIGIALRRKESVLAS